MQKTILPIKRATYKLGDDNTHNIEASYSEPGKIRFVVDNIEYIFDMYEFDLMMTLRMQLMTEQS